MADVIWVLPSHNPGMSSPGNRNKTLTCFTEIAEKKNYGKKSINVSNAEVEVYGFRTDKLFLQSVFLVLGWFFWFYFCLRFLSVKMKNGLKIEWSVTMLKYLSILNIYLYFACYVKVLYNTLERN